ncbi:serine/threonine protein kinase [Paenibacillus montanisoli]|uniref:Protein kinase family protein n=1 Tax=Paenibacillus montanisoli TaxID=2081970 RepID=A0A328U4E9_9BACL|nr:protein kinase family protein [Paenibacillus montanisoli]RAP74736.1 protein kinase family protein [Paenibacillus montanisoli]
MLGTRFRQRWQNWVDYPLRQGAVYAGKYRVERFLGMGSYGQAYRCIDLSSGLPVLMKRGKPSKRGLAREMLKRESDMLQRLDHPQIPKWLDYAAHRKEEVLVMELVEGDNLEHAIMEQGRMFTQQEALYLVRQLLRPIRHMHEAGYVHRDVRIPNVLASGDRIYLIDVGLACRIGEAAAEGEPIGFADSWGAVKHRMRVPEPASDLYGLGHLFLFLMYAGYKPLEGQEERGWEEELALEPAVKAFVQGLLESKWRTAAECEQELDRILA